MPRKIKATIQQQRLPHAPKVDVPPDPNKPHATKKQVAEHFRVTQRTIEHWVNDGLPHFKRGRTIRFKIVDVEAYTQQGHSPLTAHGKAAPGS